MKTLLISKAASPKASHCRSGYSLLELLMVVAVISSVMAAGYFAVTSFTGAARAGKLHSDVVTLNNAVRTYLTHGGRIPASADGPAVVNKLKSTANRTSGNRIAGLKGTMLDARLRGELVTVDGPERAVWNQTKLRFELSTSGTGFSSFDLGADPALAEVEEDRTATLSLAQKDHWVWDSSESTTASRAPREVQTAVVASIEPPPPGVISRLAPPDVSMPGTLYDFSAFNPTLAVSLVDRNMPGKSRIFYSLESGPWIEYTGTPLQIPPRFTTTLRTYAAATDSDNYEDSDQRTEKYETIYFTGTSTGKFHTPVGDSRLKTNLAPGQRSANFKWGDPATADKKQNELNFSGASFSNVAPDSEFVVGSLDYYNGTTYSGTNATAVQIAIDLDLTTPGVKESLNFTFGLKSTPNLGKNADADADYVYIPDVSTNFRTVIKGQTFALVLRFGEHGPNGFTTINTFHAHEGKTLRGTIYGRLTAVSGQN